MLFRILFLFCLFEGTHETNSPTFSTQQVILYSDNTLRSGNLGTRSATDTICFNTAQSLSLACRSYSMFITYSTSTLSSLQSTLLFDASTSVFSIDGTFLGVWSQVIGNSGLASLDSGNVFSSTGVNYWTGCAAAGCSGTPTNNCNNWSSGGGGFSGVVGLSSSSDIVGTGSTALCGNTRRQVCICVQGSLPTPFPTTGTPTQAPTTKTPTKTPTNAPTLPTAFPTKRPTKTPTTKSPTKNPTQFPTGFPTSSPVQAEPIRYLYKLPEGSRVVVTKNSQNITYSHVDTIPTNITIRSLGNAFIPIAWENLEYRIWDPSTNLTTTETLSDPCNPGHPNEVPGEYYEQADGVYTCPTIERCILTDDCTDELAPYADFTSFPDLRACWCSYDEIAYPAASAPVLDSSVALNLQIFEGNMYVEDPQPPPEGVLGNIRCNTFIDREINCQLARLNPLYIFQCEDEPIGCYDFTLGRFFGGFFNQNPKFQYSLNFDDWGLDHYKGIASVMNNLTYAKNGIYVDPFTSELWNDYFWISSNTSLSVLTEPADFVFSSYQTYLIQADPFTYLLNSKPPPMVDYLVSREPNAQEQACIASLAPSTAPTPACDAVTWESEDGPAFRLSGLEYTFPLPENQNVLSVEITFRWDANDIKGLELYNAWGELCGSVYSNEFTIGSEFVFLCLNTANAGTVHPEPYLTMRVLGQNSYYDIPQSNLNSNYMNTPTDPLYAYLDLLAFQSFTGDTWPLVYPLAYDFGLLENPKCWPQRSYLNSSLINNIPFTATYNYTVGSSSSGQVAQAWENVSISILEYNIYPENEALREVEHLYDIEEIDFESPKQLEYLRNIWEVQLARRYCGADYEQCDTFDLGLCIIESDVKQRWFNGDKDATYDFEGKEGGCRCYYSFPQGFFKSEVFCQQCASGYGPLTMADLSETVQYNILVSPVLPTDMIPSDSMTLEQFENTWICRYPYALDPVVASLDSINICAGHGNITYEQSEQEFTQVLLQNKYFVACTSLSMGNSTYELEMSLEEPYTVPFNLIYMDEYENILVVLGNSRSSELYLTESETSLVYSCSLQCETEASFPLPWTCAIVCENGFSDAVTCVNDVFFTPNDMYFDGVNAYVYLENRFLISNQF